MRESTIPLFSRTNLSTAPQANTDSALEDSSDHANVHFGSRLACRQGALPAGQHHTRGGSTPAIAIKAHPINLAKDLQDWDVAFRSSRTAGSDSTTFANRPSQTGEFGNAGTAARLDNGRARMISVCSQLPTGLICHSKRHRNCAVASPPAFNAQPPAAREYSP